MKPSLVKPGLVIFDCDGVLVDSEPIANRVLHRLLAGHGADLTPEGCMELFRGKSRFAVEQYMDENGLALSAHRAEDFYAGSFEAFRRELRPVEGAVKVVERLRDQGVDICVASNGTLAKMHVSLSVCGLIDHFRGRMFSAYDAGRSKPAPDVFLHAARACGHGAGACVVVEDSLSGMEAAARAGMRCLAYLPEPQTAGAERFGASGFRDMNELPALLGCAGPGADAARAEEAR